MTKQDLKLSMHCTLKFCKWKCLQFCDIKYENFKSIKAYCKN